MTLLPDYDFTVVGGASEDVAEFRVGPGDLPNRAFVAVDGVSLAGEVRGWGGGGYPRKVSSRRWLSRSISKILMVLSEEQVWEVLVGRGWMDGGAGWRTYSKTFSVIVQSAVMLDDS